MLRSAFGAVLIILVVHHVSDSQSAIVVGAQRQIEEICPALQRCRCGLHNEYVSYIYCARQNLRSIPALSENSTGLHKRLDKTELLYIFDEFVLSGNLISTIEKDSFIRSVRRFRLLDLSDNPITFIDPAAFVPTKYFIRSLKISFANKVTILDTEWLRPLRSLNYLKMSNVKLSSTSIYIPTTVRQLVLQQGQFVANTMMERSNGSERPNDVNFLLRLLPEQLISFQLSHWHNLDKSYFLETATSIRLENLSLLSSGLFSVPPTLCFKHVKSLDLSFNNINSAMSLAAIRVQFPALITINIRHNQLTEEAIQDTAALNNIEVLNLDYNPLEQLFVLPESMKEISARYTLLKSLKQIWFTNAKNLVTLDLQGNTHLQRIDCKALTPLTARLSSLNLAYFGNGSSNNLQCLLDQFTSGSHPFVPLQRLNVRSTGLQGVPPGISKLKNLRFLDISDNPLTDLDWLMLPSTTYKLFADNLSTHQPATLSFGVLPSELEILSFNENDFYWQRSQRSTQKTALQTFMANRLLNCNCSVDDLAQWLGKHGLSAVQCAHNQRDLMTSLNVTDCHFKQLSASPDTGNKIHVSTNMYWSVDYEYTGTVIKDKNVLAIIRWNTSRDTNGFKGFEVSASNGDGWIQYSPFLSPHVNK